MAPRPTANSPLTPSGSLYLVKESVSRGVHRVLWPTVILLVRRAGDRDVSCKPRARSMALGRLHVSRRGARSGPRAGSPGPRKTLGSGLKRGREELATSGCLTGKA